MAAAETDLCTLADVKAWLNVLTADHDVALQRLVSGCSAFMQRYMQRTIIQQDYSYVTSGPGATFMVVRYAPLVSVDSISVDGRSVDPSLITFDESTIYLSGAASFTRGRMNVALALSAGYDTVPLDLAQACIETVGLRWRERDRIGLSSKGLANETTAFTLVDFPVQVRALMDTYKRVVPV